MKSRVLQISTTTLQYDGLTEVLLTLCNHADSEWFDVEIVLGKGAIPRFIDKLNKKGIKYYMVPDRELDVKNYIPALRKIIKQGRYDVVHVHGNSATMALDLFIAMNCGVKCRIAHSHNTRTNHPVIHKMMQPILNVVTTYPVACGEEAGKYLFGRKPFNVIPNYINVSTFKFNQKIRDEIRKKLNFENKFIIGNVGRFSYQKNHEFMIDIFAAVHKQIPNTVLLLIGEGCLLDSIKEKVKKLSLDESVVFCGVTDKVSELLQAIDLFLLPSHYEGLSVTALEAQASGLPCIMSTKVSRETMKSDNCEFVSLESAPEKWADVISKYLTMNIVREDGAKAITDAGYDESSLNIVLAKTWRLQN